MPIPYTYPQNNWATRRMRRNGQAPEEGDDANIYQVSDVRRGRPELEEPGIAEAEKLAGSGLFARGGTTADLGRTGRMAETRASVIRGATGISPEIIEQHKSELRTLIGDQLARGVVDFRKIDKWSHDRNWTSILDLTPAPKGQIEQMASEGIAAKFSHDVAQAADNLEHRGDEGGDQLRNWSQSYKDAIANSKGTEWEKTLQALKRVGIPILDPNKKLHFLGHGEEQ